LGSDGHSIGLCGQPVSGSLWLVMKKSGIEVVSLFEIGAEA
jgi:hypothetical protein